MRICDHEWSKDIINHKYGVINLASLLKIIFSFIFKEHQIFESSFY
jgi:hypothetical protein